MSEVRFYQLASRRVEDVLPVMLERVLARGGRAVVRGGNAGRIEALDRLLWIRGEGSFLPHGRDGDPMPEAQPVWLTTAAGVPNGAGVLFLLDGAAADPAEMAACETVALLFEGSDGPEVEAARSRWRAVVAAGLTAVYWAEAPGGGWQKKATSGG